VKLQFFRTFYLRNLIELPEELVESEDQLVGGQGLGEGGKVHNIGVEDAHVVVALQSRQSINNIKNVI
jgi:hypothetical protein